MATKPVEKYRCTIELEATDSLTTFAYDILSRTFKLLRALKIPVTFEWERLDSE